MSNSPSLLRPILGRRHSPFDLVYSVLMTDVDLSRLVSRVESIVPAVASSPDLRSPSQLAAAAVGGFVGSILMFKQGYGCGGRRYAIVSDCTTEQITLSITLSGARYVVTVGDRATWSARWRRSS